MTGIRVAIELTPGDALDRFAIATVKSLRMSGRAREIVDAERARYAAACEPLLQNYTVCALMTRLTNLHQRTFELLDRMIPCALNGEINPDDHIDAARLNRERVRLIREIDTCWGCGPDSEIKSYYEEGQ